LTANIIVNTKIVLKIILKYLVIDSPGEIFFGSCVNFEQNTTLESLSTAIGKTLINFLREFYSFNLRPQYLPFRGFVNQVQADTGLELFEFRIERQVNFRNE
jgi:hypothetical protein